jgi:ResB protein required for cytochrome c biosynthesis
MKPSPSWAKSLYDRLSSMTLAIVLLVVLALASAIGTVLLQNQEQTDYLRQFGPLWYGVFHDLGLFDMYHTGWFLGMLGFLMLSLALCLWRNVPRMLREMSKRRIVIADKSLKRFHHHQRWLVKNLDMSRAQAMVGKVLAGWEKKSAENEGRLYIRADKGRHHKWGYILVHGAILIILAGGWVSVHYGFRGNMNVVEGGTEDSISFLKDMQVRALKMPFAIRCDKFFIDFYPTGMPKEFRSTLSIIDHGKVVVDHKDIIVNEPLLYKGVRIYQASFGDGGSKIRLKLYRLDDGSVQTVDTRVYRTWRDKKTGVSLEVTNFRPYNIENMAGAGQPKAFKDLGPAVEYIIRGPGLKPVKIKSFMRPFELNGRNVGTLIMVSLSGENRDYQPFSLGLDFSNPKEWKLLRAFTRRLQAEKGKRDEKVNLAAFKAALKDVYGSRRPAHFQDAGLRVLQAMKNLSQVPWPFIPILEDYEQVYYTGLQLTKDPGMNIIWAGSALLVVGLCIMFYMPHRKLWVVLQEKSGRLEVNVAGMTNRNKLGFERDFHEILKKMEQAIHSSPTQGERI